jgi:hypothetical protein
MAQHEIILMLKCRFEIKKVPLPGAGSRILEKSEKVDTKNVLIG